VAAYRIIGDTDANPRHNRPPINWQEL
jgi:hypothetical protein